MRKVLEKCPTCEQPMHVTRMACPSCGTRVEAEYEPCPFCSLEPKHSKFLQAFVKARGNIKEIERELGVSYSTARSMLDDLLQAMGYDPGLTKVLGSNPTEREIMDALADRRITREQALRLLERR